MADSHGKESIDTAHILRETSTALVEQARIQTEISRVLVREAQRKRTERSRRGGTEPLTEGGSTDVKSQQWIGANLIGGAKPQSDESSP